MSAPLDEAGGREDRYLRGGALQAEGTVSAEEPGGFGRGPGREEEDMRHVCGFCGGQSKRCFECHRKDLGFGSK